VKNTDYVVYLTSSRGRTWRYLKDKTGWKQLGPEGQQHRMTPEQLLNHLLPAVAGIKPLTVQVVYRGPPRGWLWKAPPRDAGDRMKSVPTGSAPHRAKSRRRHG
jgi:hypothetical protein